MIATLFSNLSERKIFAVLFLVSVLAGGSSIAYLTHVAHTSDTKMARGFPTASDTMPGEFATLTINMVDHGVFSMATTSPYTPNMWRTPGYSVFLAPFYALTGSFYPALFAQILLVFLTTVLVFKIAERFMDRKWALGLSVLYIILPTTLLSVATIMNETLYTLTLMGAIYLFFFSEVKSMYAKFALTGFILALAAYIKPGSLYILFFFLPAYFALYLPWKEISRKHLYAALLMIVVFVGTLAPWCIRNQTVLGSGHFASTSAFQLFRHNATQFYEAYHDIPNIEARYALQDMAGMPHGSVPLDMKYAEVMKKVALQVIFEHPFSYAMFHLSTFIPFFASSGIIDYERFVYVMLPEFSSAEEPSLLQAIHPLSIPLLMTVLSNHGWTLVENSAWAFVTLLALIGLLYGKNVRMARMLFAVVLYFAVVTGPIAHARYRAPIEPLLLIGAFATVVYAHEKRDWRTLLTKVRKPQQ